MKRALLFYACCIGLSALTVAAQDIRMPNRSQSVRFGVIGDFGNGDKVEYENAAKMAEFQKKFPFDFMITVGDNLIGGERPQDFTNKFEAPYKPILDAGVKVYASLGNHDDPKQVSYPPFNMGDKRYYTYTKKNAQFFALDSNYMDQKQLDWLDHEMKASKAEWKIPYFHHPLYSSGGTHGSSIDLRQVLEPIFLKYGVQVVFNGHDHFYERIKPEISKGIYYFVAGSAGQLRTGDITKTNMTAFGFDRDRTFMLIEIADDALFFETVSRVGNVIDTGCIPRAADLKPSTSRVTCQSTTKGAVK